MEKRTFSFRATDQEIVRWRAWIASTGAGVDAVMHEAITEYIANHPLDEVAEGIYKGICRQKGIQP